MTLPSQRAWVQQRYCALVFLLGVHVAAPLEGQWQSSLGPRGAMLGAPVGSDVERYVRTLSIAGVIEPLSWGTRPLGADEISRLLPASDTAQHPWGLSLRNAASTRGSLGLSGVASVNTGFPWGANDGPLWQGRGVTAALGTAATFRFGALRATFAPVAFIAQNASYRLMPTAGSNPLQAALRPTDIDLPQRFGTASYARLDAGESNVRLVAGPLSFFNQCFFALMT